MDFFLALRKAENAERLVWEGEMLVMVRGERVQG